MNILFIDSDEYYQSIYKARFADLGEVRVHSRGEGVLEIIKQFEPHIIVSEVLLPDCTIYELLEEIKDVLAERNDTKVVIFSKIAKMEDIAAAMKYGVNGFFVKGQDSLNDLKNLMLTQSHNHGL